jgi:formylglycine-generating enzyme required for sulfatase activity
MLVRSLVLLTLSAFVAALGAACTAKKGELAQDAEVDQDAAALPDADAALSLCKKDKVTCADGETNAYGVCLPAGAMVKVPAGAFRMGFSEQGKDHAPERSVTLKAFTIDKTEVTTAAYQACVACGICGEPLRDGSHTGREPYYGNPAYQDYPVVYITWNDAKAYCAGIDKRLPTEAEWEKAARGPNGAKYPWGDVPATFKHANYLDSGKNDTTAVSEQPEGKSAYGALNLAGNVWEWVADSYAADYYAKAPAADPPGPAESAAKVARGGGFLSAAEELKSYRRASHPASAALSYLGFRCAK